VTSVDLLSAYHGAYALLCPNLGNENSDAGHIICSCGLQIPPWLKTFSDGLCNNMWCKWFEYGFIYLWYNTMIVTIERKMRFRHMLPFMTKQRCSSAPENSRLHQKFGIIYSSVATSDILTSHQM